MFTSFSLLRRAFTTSALRSSSSSSSSAIQCPSASGSSIRAYCPSASAISARSSLYSNRSFYRYNEEDDDDNDDNDDYDFDAPSSSPTPIIEPSPTSSPPSSIECMNRNARIPKAPNHGARPNCHYNRWNKSLFRSSHLSIRPDAMRPERIFFEDRPLFKQVPKCRQKKNALTLGLSPLSMIKKNEQRARQLGALQKAKVEEETKARKAKQEEERLAIRAAIKAENIKNMMEKQKRPKPVIAINPHPY